MGNACGMVRPHLGNMKCSKLMCAWGLNSVGVWTQASTWGGTHCLDSRVWNIPSVGAAGGHVRTHSDSTMCRCVGREDAWTSLCSFAQFTQSPNQLQILYLKRHRKCSLCLHLETHVSLKGPCSTSAFRAGQVYQTACCPWATSVCQGAVGCPWALPFPLPAPVTSSVQANAVWHWPRYQTPCLKRCNSREDFTHSLQVELLPFY